MTINKLNGTECGTEIAKIINRLISEKSDTDLGNLSSIGQAILDGKSSISLDNLSAAGQAILDKKVEVEALLQQNGYAKFTWKENNQISNLIIQYGWVVANATGAYNVNFPIAFNETPRIFAQYVSGDYETTIACISITRKYTQAGFELYNTLNGSRIWHAWFAIGK